TGYWCFGAVYSGSSSYQGSSDQTTDECVDVTPAPSGTASTPSSTSVGLGGSVTDTAYVIGNSVGNSPTGSVSFYECGPTASAQSCTSQSHQVGGAVTLTTGAYYSSDAASASFTPTAVGYWCFAFVYSGSSDYQGSSDTSTGECVDVTPGSSTTVSTPSNSTIELGQNETDSATVTGNATGGSPTGTVKFYECGPTNSAQSCTSEANEVGGAVSVSAGAHDTSSATSATFTPGAEGTWCFAAVYSGSSDYLGSSDETTDECFDVTGPVTIETSSLPSGTVDHSYSATLQAEGGTPPYTWSHPSSPLPHGLSLNTSTGQITGTPTQTGSTTVTFEVKDSSHPKETATKSLTITISS
ncbi:MAG TPA: Ig domain-containing protein, partial [Acidimicrobiales bacterium]|nr:Ig domain-containing protein [Acidimicrobiales bacterium]